MPSTPLAILSGLFIALGQVTGPGAVPPQLAPGKAAIVGRVVEAGTTDGVADAVVTLSGAALGSAQALFTDGTPGGNRLVASDSQGRFAFRGLPAGTFNINVSAPGYVNGAYGETRPIPIRRTLDLVRTIEAAADVTENVTIQLWKQGGISGQVLDDAGDPVVGMQVSVLARMTDWGGPVMQLTTSAVTDDRGSYHVEVTPGDYVVGILAATVTVPASASAEFQRAQAQGGTAMNTYMNNMIASGALLPRGIGTRVGPLLVHQLGSLNTPAVPPLIVQDGQMLYYPSTFHPAAPNPATASLVTVGSGEEKTGVNVHVRLAPVRRLSGRVVGPEGPVSGIAVRLLPQDPAVFRTSPATLIDTPQAMTDGNGEFTFIGVSPGTYTARAVRSAQRPVPDAGAGGTLWASTPVAIGNEDGTDVQLVMQRGVVITGRVEIESSAGKPIPLDRLLVGPRPLPGSIASTVANTMNVQPDPSGTFTTREAIPGPYVMTVTGVPPGLVLKSVTAHGQNIVDKAFELTTAGLDGVVVTFTDRISTLTGTVRNADGRPSPLATIAVFPVDKSLWRSAGVASRRVQTAAPGRLGTYSFRGLPAGDYYVVAAEWLSADFSNPDVLATLIPAARRVTIGDGGTQTVDLRTVIK